MICRDPTKLIVGVHRWKIGNWNLVNLEFLISLVTNLLRVFPRGPITTDLPTTMSFGWCYQLMKLFQRSYRSFRMMLRFSVHRYRELMSLMC